MNIFYNPVIQRIDQQVSEMPDGWLDAGVGELRGKAMRDMDRITQDLRNKQSNKQKNPLTMDPKKIDQLRDLELTVAYLGTNGERTQKNQEKLERVASGKSSGGGLTWAGEFRDAYHRALNGEEVRSEGSAPRVGVKPARWQP